MKEKLVIVGASGHAISVCNVALSAGFDVQYFVDRDKSGQIVFGIKVVNDIEKFLDDKFVFAIGVGSNFVREQIYQELKEDISLNQFPPVIHDSAVVSSFSSVGFGTIVMPNVTIGPNCNVGNFCLVNTNSSVDHDCFLHDYSSLAPGTHTGGNVTVGSRSALLIGAKVKHGIAIGNDTVVGANSYVNDNIGDHKVSYGTPARIIKKRGRQEEYLA